MREKRNDALIAKTRISISDLEDIYDALFSVPQNNKTRKARAYLSEMVSQKQDNYITLMKKVVPRLKRELSYKEISSVLGISEKAIIRDGRYGGGFTVGVKKEVRERDRNKCANCDTLKGMKIVHHKGNPQNNELKNLILLCRSCHQEAHKNISTNALAN